MVIQQPPQQHRSAATLSLLISPHRTYNTHFATRHESQIARRMVVEAASTDPLATSPYAFNIAFCAYNTHFATRHESQIARRMVVQAASTATQVSPNAQPSQQSTSYLQYSLCNSTRISNCTTNGTTSSLHSNTGQSQHSAFSAVHSVPTILTLQLDTNLQLHEEW